MTAAVRPPPKPKGQVCETKLIRWEKNHVNPSLAEAVSGKTDWKGREGYVRRLYITTLCNKLTVN